MASGTVTRQIIDVVTPAAGESVTEGTILEWRVKVGDTIAADDTIVEISTDKVDVELPSPATGTVLELLVAEGDTVTVGQVIARIAVGDEAPSDNGAPAAPAAADDAADGALVDVLTPAAGESVSEGTILEWHVKVGDAIATDETIVEISTDKVDLELPSPATGTVAELLVQEGDTVTVGQVIARIAVGAASQGDGQRRSARPEHARAGLCRRRQRDARRGPRRRRRGRGSRRASPDPGRAGRITKSDVLTAAEDSNGAESPDGAASVPLRGAAAALARHMEASLADTHRHELPHLCRNGARGTPTRTEERRQARLLHAPDRLGDRSRRVGDARHDLPRVRR